MRRRTLARRTPVIVYRFERDEDTVKLHAWEADEQGRINDSRRRLTSTELIEPVEVHERWFSTLETDVIHDLPEQARGAVFELDDAIRWGYKTGIMKRGS